MKRLLLCVPLAFFPALIGCNTDHAENKGTDNAYIRAPGDKAGDVTLADGPLFPVTSNNQWTWTVVTHRRSRVGTSIRDEVIKQETEQVVQLDGGAGKVILETRKNGKPFRQEVFAVTGATLLLDAAGLGEKVTMQPPLPLLTLPPTEGQSMSWTGLLRYQNVSVPGTAYSRVSGKDKVETGAGTFGAWRVETMIGTTVQGQQVSFPMTRWFAPGKGMVRQKLYIGALTIDKTLMAFQSQ